MANTLLNIKISTICYVFSVLIYCGISKIIFDKVFATSELVIDEEFHIPLGLSYCNGNYYTWDPKVTTLPGLYLISSAIFGPLNLCTTYWLRCVSLGASVINNFLFFELVSKYDQSKWRNILSSVTFSVLPPLYFFSHLYYTDVVSVTMVLLMLVFNQKEYHCLASLFGVAAVICRQTNIIWVAFITGRYALKELYVMTMVKYVDPPIETGLPLNHLRHFTWVLLRQPQQVLKSITPQFVQNISAYLTVLLLFLAFVVYNGSIVVGDKNAHEATIHFPQLFYFSLFCLIFAWPHFVGEISSFIAFAKKHQLLILSAVVIGMIIVFKNTLVHPYMLADNRHYVFYIWNRFYGKYLVFRFAMVPVYVFAWYVIIKLMYDKNDISILLVYLLCVTAVLITQKLIEVRYYLLPYIIFRLHIKSNATTVFNAILEFVTFILINCITFNLFFTKIILWDDYDDPQRIIW